MRGILTATAVCLAACLLIIPSARAEMLLDVSGELGPEPESKVEQFPFQVLEPKTRLGLSAEVDVSEGTWKLRILDPAGETITSMSCGAWLRLQNQPQGTIREAGEATLEVSTENAVGTWHVTLSDLPAPKGFALLFLPGPLMVMVGLAFVLGWKVRSRTQWRWFLAGAGIWTVGVAPKFLWAFLLHKPILEGLKASMPHPGYVATGGIYIGLLTGIFEIGVTLFACLIWKAMARDPKRAVAVGVGAGAFEAILVGLVVLLATATPVASLIPPVERVIAILCHTSSRTLVLLSVARRRWSFFWYGFAIMTAIDAIAGGAILSGAAGRISMWWIELAIAPFALASLPIIAWCLRHWPQQTPPPPEQPAETD